MLSYRHAYHAGNHADVLKHLTQVLILESLQRKAKPFLYLDTHSGAGLYDLQSDAAEKTGEYIDGIAKVMVAADVPVPMQSYMDLVRQLNQADQLSHYPGSPWVAQCFMREQDRAQLYELHPTDSRILKANMAESDKRIKVYREDGFHQLKAALPPPEKRALVLIDPPYEVKSDYETVVKAVAAGVKRFATGIYAIWYPVVQRSTIDQLEADFKASGIRNILIAELNVQGDSDAHGMTGSGMIVVNPPWQLADKLKESLPWITETLKLDANASWRVEMLVDE